jgi:hypothetical protein
MKENFILIDLTRIVKDMLYLCRERMFGLKNGCRILERVCCRLAPVLELLHTHLGFIFPKVFTCLLVIISHYLVSYILGENIPPGEYSLSVDTSV